MSGGYKIVEFDLEDVPLEFDPDVVGNERRGNEFSADYHGYKLGRRRYAILYVKNTIGSNFFLSDWDRDCAWHFAEKGFFMFANYNAIPLAIRNNAVEFSFRTLDDSSDLSFIPFNMTFSDRKELMPSKDNCDFVLVRQFIFDYEQQDNEDLEILGEVCLNGLWAGGRYLMRITCLSEIEFFENELDSIINFASDVYTDGWFSGGRYWANP